MPKTLNVGMIGYAFMGKAHSHAFRDVAFFFPELETVPVMKAICGRHETAVREAAERFGWQSYETDAMKLIARDDIDVIDIASPGWAHHDQVLAAAKAGKHIICEKPIANTLKEAKEMTEAVNKAGVKNFVMFAYRRVPALALAKQMIEAGEIGEIYHFRAFYLQDWITDPNFPMVWRLEKDKAGSGSLGDIGSHIIDMSRFLVGEITDVSAMMRTFIKERPILEQASKGGLAQTGAAIGSQKGRVTVDDAAAWLANFDNGAMGTFEASRFANGRKNFNGFELYGSKGSLCFNFEDMNRLQFFSKKDKPTEQGFHNIIVTEPDHPYMRGWWPAGHIIGYQNTFVNCIHDFFQALSKDQNPAPDFDDALRVQAVMEAVEQSANQRAWVNVQDLL